MSKVRQLFLLVVKDFKLQFRHPWVTAFELGVPLIFSALLVLIRARVQSEYIPNPTVYPDFGLTCEENFQACMSDWTLFYAPDSVIIGNVMQKAGARLDYPTIIGVPSEDDIVQFYTNSSFGENQFAGVVFEGKPENVSSLDHLTYKIRLKAVAFPDSSSIFQSVQGWRTKYSFPFIQVNGPRAKDDPYGGNPGYMKRKFLPIQHAVALAVISVLSGEDVSDDIKLKRFPYPPYHDDQFVTSLEFFLPVALMFSFIYPCLNIVKNIVAEKEKGLKEFMKMMGLNNWMHSIAWAIKYFLFLSVSCFLMTVLLTAKFGGRAVINYSDPTLVFFVVLVYATCTIAFSFFLSVFFSKANSAAAGTGIIFFLSITPYFFVFPRYMDLSLSSKLASCTMLNTALAIATIVLLKWEGTGVGLQWENLYSQLTPDDELTMNYVLLMMVADAVVYVILAWYIGAVFPGEFGIPESWYFPFTRSYWCGQRDDFEDLRDVYDNTREMSDFIEPEPVDLLPGIQMLGLTKVYHKNKLPAVNNLYANMYRGQITVLLGHNGAGKTTTISMLTGLFPPTSGIAIVNGHDICEGTEEVHSSLGICPQRNVLFDDLTVEEHLYFFCKLKGYISELVTEEVDQVVRTIGLENKRYALAKTLSGGMKRKLCVGIALVGGSQIVMLDEPTSGMDPSARRFIWDFLQAEKEDRTILLTTHSMEEADILGDRIAIMVSGEIQCFGSPLFLKKKYGAGYYLVIVKKPGCDVSAVTSLVQSYIPNIEVCKNIGAELSYFLPIESSCIFQNLFEDIEAKKDSLMIGSYGASITTMEEVFMKVGQKALDISLHSNAAEIQKVCSSSLSTDSGAQDLDHAGTSSPEFQKRSFDINGSLEKNVGAALFFQQLRALLLKKALYSSRNWILTLSQVLLPPFFLSIGLIMLKTYPAYNESPPLNLGLTRFHWTKVPYATVYNNSEEMRMASYFKSLLTQKDQPVKVDNMTAYLLGEAEKSLARYGLHEIIGLTINHDESKNLTHLLSWFNNQAYHSPAIALLHMDNVLLKYFVNSSYSLSVVNHPFPVTDLEKAEQLQIQPVMSYQISQNIVFGMAFLVASFSVFLVKERASKSKHLQLVSGVNLFSFWLAAFMWDFVCYIMSCILLLIVFACFGTEGMSSTYEQGRLVVLLMVHGFASISCVYVFSFGFKMSSTAYVSICLIAVVGGIGTVLTVTVLEIPQIDSEAVASILDWIFSAILPNYCLGRSISSLYQNALFDRLCVSLLQKVPNLCSLTVQMDFLCCPGKCGNQCFWNPNFFGMEKPGIGKQLVFLSVQFFAFLFILTALEMRYFRRLKYCLRRHKIVPVVGDECVAVIEDEAVHVERQKILTTSIDELSVTNRLILSQLTKCYGSLVAVEKLSFGVHKGECFGLLGLNGAGKTTTFQMITGERSMSSGDVYLDGLSVRKFFRKVQQKIGYCPQFDALIGELTGRETLTLYARLRGLPENIISDQVSRLGTLLSFHVYIDRLVREYSGGNKRKLSVAVALIGDPSMVFLDEPTAGMDPVARHKLWDALLLVLRSGRSIVLTSHSMDECEALCNRLAIMVNGRFCCLGTPQQLKSKFGQGFSLVVKVRRPPPHLHVESTSVDDAPLITPPSQLMCSHLSEKDAADFRNNIELVKKFIRETFSGSELRDAHEGYLNYYIPKSDLSWSQMFGAIESAKDDFNITDYSIGQTTLEQVFLNFAQAQRERKY